MVSGAMPLLDALHTAPTSALPLHPAGYYSGGQDYYTHMEGGGFDLHVDQGVNCGANCSVVDWPNKGVYR